ncbi:MAG: undecaprenyl/decaprenyl-phosphate alpha-N-acetylglucosaminyl 1-phosphate transferase [Acidobacteria bacterium]|nr:undecaprenyl/decaprenyl-phosphate alpha-N-acetylglucosaminyl 1-phosphate transferase [Acidobacteriota bacterium]
MTLIYLECFVAALLLSFVLTRTIRNLAVNRRWLPAQFSKHHIHNTPVPRLGGVAIYASFASVTGVLIFAAKFLHVDTGLPLRTISHILLAGTIVFLVGLWDDIRPVHPYIKIAVQSLAATLLYFQDFRIVQLKLFFGDYDLGMFALPLTILWMLLITNAFNLIDGLDGLAGGSALFSTITVFVIAINSNSLVAILTVTLAGTILGFLRFNFNPATIFLGDCGSLFIGFMLGAFALVGAQKTSTIVAVAIPVVSFGLPILETALSIIRRFLNGQPLFGADRGHIHHKLLERGFSQRQAVIILYGVSAGCGLLSMFLLTPGGSSTGIVLFVLGVGVWVGVQHLGYHEFFELGRIAQRTLMQKQIIINNLAIRKAADHLAKAQSQEEVYEVLAEAFAKNDFDGFLLSLYDEPVEAVKPSLDMGQSVEDNEQWYRWGRSVEELSQLPVWTLTLDLMAKDQQQLGYFLVYRSYNDSHCKVDVNLLISVLQTALVEAVSRIMKIEEEVYVGRMPGLSIETREPALVGLDELRLKRA